MLKYERPTQPLKRLSGPDQIAFSSVENTSWLVNNLNSFQALNNLLSIVADARWLSLWLTFLHAAREHAAISITLTVRFAAVLLRRLNAPNIEHG